jgi:uncharacterized protein YcbX
VLKLSEIWIYPVKSLGGIRLKTARVLEKGLQHDRRWMLVDREGKFLTQRVYPEMALFKLSINDHQLSVTHSKKQSVHTISLQPHLGNEQHRVTIWDDVVSAFEVSADSSSWFSQMLGIPCKLVFFPEENERKVDPRYATADENVSLADGYPFLIIGEASLADLNSKLQKPLPMNRFRPNFVFSGGNPYEEDRWKQFSIGSNRFIGVKPCSRCVLTTVDQETAEKSDEPLRTLATYRKRENKIYFGQNVLAVDHTFVTEGDAIHLREVKRFE